MLFSYKAKRNTGEIFEAELEAQDRFALFNQVKEQGAEVISLKEVKKRKISFSFLHFGRKVKSHDKITFARNLSSMIEAGLSVSRALTVMERQASNPVLKTTIAGLNNNISQGSTLSDSMLKYPTIFSSLFISMVRAGEQSGTLSASLKVVALQMDRSLRLQQKIRGAMMYPAIILGVMVLIAILMLTYIVPTLTSTFTELKIVLPWSTRLVVAISDLLLHHGVAVLIFGIVFGVVMKWWSKTSQAKFIVHKLITKIPLIGELVREVNTARTARTMSSLLNAGVEVLQSIKITEEVLQNVHYKKILRKVSEHIEKGLPMSDVFNESTKFYPVFIGEMVAVGEETGKVGEMLLGVANYYEDDVEQRTKDISTIIEPLLMVFIGGAVGFFALAMISPMYSLVNVI